jgi:conjugal transfer pilus assembly protein TraF
MGFKRSLIFLCALLCAINSYGKNYYQTHAQGWHWYAQTTPWIPPSAATHPNQTMKAMQTQLKTALNRAVLVPTPAHVLTYLRLQTRWSTQAHRFAHIWQQVLRNTPEQDYQQQHPTNRLAKVVYYHQQDQHIDQALQHFFQHTGLFFFYRSHCPYCHAFAPLLKDFAHRYHATIIPISLDGGILPNFPQSRPDQGQAARFGVHHVPALFAVIPQTHQILPISQGLVSQNTLRQRLFAAIKVMKP